MRKIIEKLKTFFSRKSDKMSKYLLDVSKFHKTFNHPINDMWSDVDLKYRRLRVSLLFEELEELSRASDVSTTFMSLCEDIIKKGDCKEDGNNVDKVEELDALCDIQYVLSGAVLTLGHHKNFDKAFQNVQDSNMTKACKTMEEVNGTMEHYKNKGVDSYYVQRGDSFIVLRKGDEKVLKNINYTPASLKQYVYK